jgi:hypothetical protein
LIVPIPKEGKKAADQSGYRPITLTGNVGRIVERIVVNKFDKYAEKTERQFGYAKKRKCDSVPLALISRAGPMPTSVPPTLSLRNGNRRCVSLFFDMRSAFDRVPLESLCERLFHKAVDIIDPDKRAEYLMLLRWIRNYSIGREVQVRVGGEFSDEVLVNGGAIGVAQGSTIGPVLWRLFLLTLENDLAERMAILQGLSYFL